MFGIHTMLDEHFGIALVEMMAAKIIVVAHESGNKTLFLQSIHFLIYLGGPLFDIIGDKNRIAGFLGKEARGLLTPMMMTNKSFRLR